MKTTKYTVAWLVVLLSFLSIETMALIDPGSGDTLSEHVWEILTLHPLVWFTCLGIFGWIGVHLFRRTWRKP